MFDAHIIHQTSTKIKIILCALCILIFLCVKKSKIKNLFVDATGAVYHALRFFRALGVVEALGFVAQVACNAADAFEAVEVFLAAAFGADVSNDAAVAAFGVAVHGVVYGAVPDAALLHVAHYLFKRLQVPRGVAV